MDQSDGRTKLGAKRGIAGFGRGNIEDLGLGDERAHPVGPGATGNGARDAGDDVVQPFERQGARGDRLPPRRLFVEP